MLQECIRTCVVNGLGYLFVCQEYCKMTELLTYADRLETLRGKQVFWLGLVPEKHQLDQKILSHLVYYHA